MKQRKKIVFLCFFHVLSKVYTVLACYKSYNSTTTKHSKGKEEINRFKKYPTKIKQIVQNNSQISSYKEIEKRLHNSEEVKMTNEKNETAKKRGIHNYAWFESQITYTTGTIISQSSNVTKKPSQERQFVDAKKDEVIIKNDDNTQSTKPINNTRKVQARNNRKESTGSVLSQKKNYSSQNNSQIPNLIKSQNICPIFVTNEQSYNASHFLILAEVIEPKVSNGCNDSDSELNVENTNNKNISVSQAANSQTTMKSGAISQTTGKISIYRVDSCAIQRMQHILSNYTTRPVDIQTVSVVCNTTLLNIEGMKVKLFLV
ncbi:hypothetical protein RFI_23141 [Reticulomyxa filosa]|uniref:Uncharacterized protein n=1 Tax=Reticulomyxa filosa TaxID=46433 RepID=X6ML91_RETFI|nr:hypothetical protein RFI_23141 [Reticulomyxa filosa]|eukprot:ETO14227.1 hypothetical protein RFI_23141 [Reticulomyxa filosa]